MDWAPWDVDIDDHTPGDAAESDPLALRCEMYWRVPGAAVALTLLWHACRAAVRACRE